MKYKKQVYLGYDKNGKQMRKWFYADTKTELKKIIDDYKRNMKKVTNPSDVTFREYAEHWFQTYKAHLAQQTQDMCRHNLKKCEEIGNIQINKITKSMCQKVVNDSWNYPHAAKSVADVLRQVFRSAVADGIIFSNPAENLQRPKMNKPKFHLLTDVELEAVARADLPEKDRLFVTILQVFGLRPAEALALQPSDFDLDNKVLHITKALSMPNSNQSAIKSTKTGANRDIPIPDYLVPSLRIYFRRFPSFLLFEKSTGGLYTKSAYKRLSARVWKAVNIAMGGTDNLNLVSELSFYDFRHRRATDLYYLCQQGVVSPKQCAALLGHSEIIFLRTYSHLDPEKEGLSHIYDNVRAVNV